MTPLNSNDNSNHSSTKGVETMPMDKPQEWVLWTHKCGKHLSDDEWATQMHECSHFFASPASKTTAHSSQICNLDHLPLPSRNFFLKGQHTRAPQTHVEYSVFRNGFFPRWEDPNALGEWYTKHYFPANVLDHYWRTLVNAVMTGKIDDAAYVAGIRVVDKSHSKHPCYRLEIWLTSTSVPKIRDRIRDQVMQCITMDPNYAFKFHWRIFDKESKGLDEEKTHKTTTPGAEEATNKNASPTTPSVASATCSPIHLGPEVTMVK